MIKDIEIDIGLFYYLELLKFDCFECVYLKGATFVSLFAIRCIFLIYQGEVIAEKIGFFFLLWKNTSKKEEGNLTLFFLIPKA